MSQEGTFKTPASPRSAFISHASTDVGLAFELCARLESQGVRCWIAPRDLTPGNPYSSEIVHGIEGTHALILLATPSAVASENVLNELEQAHRLRKPLLTVMIGKPAVSRQLSYYIARLHWIEADPHSMESVANRLAQALQGAAPWERVGSRPSMSRWFAYGLWRLFLVPACIAAAVVLIAGFGAFHYLRAKLDTDYRGLGWVTLDAAQEDSHAPIQIGARVWIANDAAVLSELSLKAAWKRNDQQVQSIDLAGKQNPLQSANGEALTFTAPAGTSALTTCLAVPGGTRGGDRFRVTQRFSVNDPAGANPVSIAPAGAVSVKKEDGSPCGS
jgi:hypothetical protein